MKNLLLKNIAVKQTVDLGLSKHIRIMGVIGKINTVVDYLSVLTDPQRLEEYAAKAALANTDETRKPETLQEKALKVLKTLDDDSLDFVRENLDDFILTRKFQEFILCLISNNLTLQQIKLRETMRKIFYKIFYGKEKQFSRLCDLQGYEAENEIRQKGILLIKFKSLGIEVYDGYVPDLVFDLKELQDMFNMLCKISYWRQSWLVVVNTIRKMRPPKEMLEGRENDFFGGYYEKTRTLFMNKYHDNTFLRSFARALWAYKQYYFDWNSIKSFERWHKVALFLSRHLKIKYFEPDKNIADDFARIFIRMFSSEVSRNELDNFMHHSLFWTLRSNARYLIQRFRVGLLARDLGISG